MLPKRAARPLVYGRWHNCRKHFFSSYQACAKILHMMQFVKGPALGVAPETSFKRLRQHMVAVVHVDGVRRDVGSGIFDARVE